MIYDENKQQIWVILQRFRQVRSYHKFFFLRFSFLVILRHQHICTFSWTQTWFWCCWCIKCQNQLMDRHFQGHNTGGHNVRWLKLRANALKDKILELVFTKHSNIIFYTVPKLIYIPKVNSITYLMKDDIFNNATSVGKVRKNRNWRWIICHSFWCILLFITSMTFEHNIDIFQNLVAEDMICNHSLAFNLRWYIY